MMKHYMMLSDLYGRIGQMLKEYGGCRKERIKEMKYIALLPLFLAVSCGKPVSTTRGIVVGENDTTIFDVATQRDVPAKVLQVQVKDSIVNYELK